MCSFDILLPIGGAVSLVFEALFLCFRGVVLNFRGLDFNFTKVTILLHIPQYLFPFFQLLNSEAYRLRVVLRSPSDQIPSAVRSDCVRRPIRFRPPPDRIPFAVRLDFVRCTVEVRTLKLGRWHSVVDLQLTMLSYYVCKKNPRTDAFAAERNTLVLIVVHNGTSTNAESSSCIPSVVVVLVQQDNHHGAGNHNYRT